MGKPELVFSDRLEPYERWFAWWPVVTWNRRFVWLRPVWRAICVKKPYLDGGGGPFFIYATDEKNAP